MFHSTITTVKDVSCRRERRFYHIGNFHFKSKQFVVQLNAFFLCVGRERLFDWQYGREVDRMSTVEK